MLRLRASIPLLLASAVMLPALAPAQKLVMWGRNAENQCQDLSQIIYQGSAGGLHTLVLYPSGHIGSWGGNDFGQTNVPLSFVGTQVAAGGNHSLGLRTDGTVAAWGQNDQGQTNVPAGLVAKQIYAGYSHSVALKSDGSVVAWGDNSLGQLNVPAGLVATQITSGEYHNLALKSDGTVAAWGNNFYGQANVPSGLVATYVAGGGYQSLAVRTDGTVAAWGRNTDGQCNVPTGLVATKVAAGYFHSLAIRTNGTVAAWGRNTDGQCNVPGDLTGVIGVSAGGYHSMALVSFAHCVLDQTQVFGGGSATGTVKLSYGAKIPGQTINLSSSNPHVHVPSSVVVPTSATSVTFPVTTDPFIGPDITATITTDNPDAPTGSILKLTVPFPLKVKGLTASAAFGPGSTIGGSASKPKFTATLNATVDSPLTLNVVSADPTVLSLPATITIPAGANSVSVSAIRTGLVSASRTVAARLTTSDGTTVATANLTLTPLRANLTLITPSLTSGESGQGGVYLNTAVGDPVTISLSSGNAAVSVPSSVTVAAGARLALFPISTTPVATALTVPITATIAGNPFTANLKVGATPSVRSVTLPASVYGHGKITGTVRLTISGRPGGTVVQLASSDPSLSVPATVTVPEGQYTATFVATAADGDESSLATVTASTAVGSASAGVTVNPLTLSTIALSATTAASGSTVTVTVTLNATVGVDTPVALSSTNGSLVPVPATVIVPAGSRTGTISITLGSTTVAKSAKVTATKNGTSAYRTIKVTP